MNQRSAIIAFTTVLLLALLEIGFFNSVGVAQYMIHPVLLYVILNRRTASPALRVALGAFGGLLLDAFAPNAYGQWLIGLSLGVLVTDFVFTQWLSHRSWIAPIGLTILGWSCVRLVGILMSGNTGGFGEWFNATGLAFWSRDLLWTLAAAILTTAIGQLIRGQRHRYAAA
jgi:hypothetical protein